MTNEEYNNKVEQFYFEKFSNDSAFQEIYLNNRFPVYRVILKIINRLKIKSAIDIGCAYGLLVEMLNENGVDAWGLDLPIENLQKIHQGFDFAKGKFQYGSASDPEIVQQVARRHFEAVIILDTLRYIGQPENIDTFKPEYIIVKENTDSFYRKLAKMKEKIFMEEEVYSPHRCVELFSNYGAYEIYPSKYLFRVRLPGSLWLTLIDHIFPTYTMVLKRINSPQS